MSENPSIAERLRTLRSRRKLTQQEVADLANTTARTLGSWESGTTEPSASHIISLCSVFSVSADYLLGRCDHEHGLTPGTFLIDLDSVENPRDHETWRAKVPRRARIVDYDEMRRIELEVGAKRRGRKAGGDDGDR